MKLLPWLFFILLLGCSKTEKKEPFVQPDGGVYGQIFTGGQFHLGPVDWSESEWTNSCGPYPALIQQIEGNYLAGLESEHNGNGQLCDACVKIETAKGKLLIVRVITTGVTTKNSIDLSPQAYDLLNSGEYPRSMSWYVTKCPSNGENIYYQFQTQANQWWTSLWVRNIALPLISVEVKSTNHKDWFKLTRGNDGTYTDSNGFGAGSFTIRITAIDGQIIQDVFTSLVPGSLIQSSGQFK
jgi:expansin